VTGTSEAAGDGCQQTPAVCGRVRSLSRILVIVQE